MNLVCLLAGALVLALPSVGAVPKHPVARKAIHRTHVVIVRAAAAVREAGQDKADLRQAVVNQAAARWCVNHDKQAEAALLTLKARAYARNVIQANRAAFPKGETDSAEETEAAQGADQAVVNAAVARADKTTPGVEDILKDQENAGDPEPDGQAGRRGPRD